VVPKRKARKGHGKAGDVNNIDESQGYPRPEKGWFYQIFSK
jgi:hypothetical protein